MTSFSIADSKTSIELTSLEGDDADVRTGEISFTVRNITDRAEAARLRFETEDGAEDAWFSFEDAAATNPGFLEIDFESGSARTLKVYIRAKGGEDDLTCKFRIRATAESNTDNDFVEGPWVQFTVAKKEIVIPPPRCTWCKPAAYAAAAVVLAIGGFFTYQALFDTIDLQPVIGKTEADARTYLNGEEYSGEIVTVKSVEGFEPGLVYDYKEAEDGDLIELLIDPGVEIKAKKNQQYTDAMRVTGNAGLIPVTMRAPVNETDPNLGKVKSVSPSTGSFVKKGSEVTITYYEVRPEIVDRWRMEVMNVDHLREAMNVDHVRSILEIEKKSNLLSEFEKRNRNQ
jgi:predicted transcriptional regulator